MTTITLRSVKELEHAIQRLGWRMEAAILKASHSAAAWGLTKAIRETQRRRIRASGTFAASWLSRKVKDGAFVANSSEHAYFVERGRRPGRMPPLAAIEQWIKLKRLMPDKPPKVSTQAARKAVIGKGPSGNISGAKQRARLQRDVRLRTKIYKSPASRAFRHQLAIKAMALGIARKIARRGTRAKFILGKMLPALASRYRRDIQRELAKITAAPPR